MIKSPYFNIQTTSNAKSDILKLNIIKSNQDLVYRNENTITYNIKEQDCFLIGISIGKYLLKEHCTFDDIFINITENKDDFAKFYEGLLIGSWKYSGHKTKYGKHANDNNQPIPSKEKNIFVLAENETEDEVKNIENIIEATFLTRELVEMPSNLLTPSKLAEYAQNIPGLKVKVEKINKGGIWEVGKGSCEPPLLITCEYGNENDEAIALVGKGVTFDSGGLSLKPPKSMEDMKIDMAGAATVLGIMKAAASNKINKRLIAIIPCVENMPSGTALKPGDVITSLSGQTIEVLNTDAEGRLILADALYLAQKTHNAKTVINFATLTGAIIVALGELYAGLFSNNDDLSQKLIDSGNKTRETLCRLPLHKKYDQLMNSDIADMCNIGKPGGGAGSITAAQFLQRFIENDTKWAHIDIAGTARTTRESMININKSTGFGVRMIYDYIMNN